MTDAEREKLYADLRADGYPDVVDEIEALATENRTLREIVRKYVDAESAVAHAQSTPEPYCKPGG
jgi:hypothetical protein